ncbi:uncharacterized protein LOC135938055 [Cloeon dipterum]|uniref:uncharacterized protein LOC135938055 n=1 Tax=Cloeon dipterum TaxID=197152 RepID=UPI00322009DA
MGRWVYYNRTHSESLSGNPFPGGKTASGQPMWVVRTWHQGYLLPGYAVDGTGYFAFEGQVVKKDDFYVFFSDGYNYYFAPSLNQLQTDYWVVGGQTPKNEKLYVGRIRSGFDSSAVGSVLDGVCSAVLLEKKVVETSSDEYGLLQNIFLGGYCDDGN